MKIKTTKTILVLLLSMLSILCFIQFIQPFPVFAGAENKLDKAYQLLKAGDYEAAVKLFESHLEANPNDARIHLEAAYTYIKMKKDHDALLHLIKHMELVPATPEVLLETAYACLRTKKLNKAESYFSRYLEVKPRRFDIHADLAFLLLKNSKRQEAIQRMIFILENEPGQETIRLNLAFLLLEKQPKEAYRHFHMLVQSKNPETRRQAQTVLDNKPSDIGYFIYAILYHSFRFDIDVLDVRTRVYLKNSFIAPVEPYLFLSLSTDAESTVNPFPTIYSEQAAIVGAGLQWYFIKRNARLFIEYGYRTKFLKLPYLEDKKGSLSFGMESYFHVPLDTHWGLELNNVLVYHSRFDNDLLFEGREIISRKYSAGKYGYFKPYAGIMARWDTKKYFYNNNYELLVGISWSWRKDFTYFLFCEYRRGDYMKDTAYGRHYDELLAGIVVGIYR